MDELAEIRGIFFQECEEQLSELENGLLALNEGSSDLDTVNAIFRAVHSIKGGAGAFGLDELVRFAHVFETSLDAVRSGSIGTGPETVSVMMRGADLLTDLVRASRNGTAATIGFEQVAAELASLLGDGAAASAPDPDPFGFVPVPAVPDDAAAAGHPDDDGAARWRIHFTPKPALYGNGSEAGSLLRELGRLGCATTRIDLSALPGLAEMDPEGCFLGWDVTLSGTCDAAQIRDVFEFVDGECLLAVEPDPATGTAAPVGAVQAPDAVSDADILALVMRACAAEAPVVAGAPFI